MESISLLIKKRDFGLLLYLIYTVDSVDIHGLDQDKNPIK